MPVVSLVSCLIIAAGVAACMVTLATQQAISGDPFPTKSDRVFHVQVDTRVGDAKRGDPLDGVSYSDATELLQQDLGAQATTVTFSTLLPVGAPNHPTRAMFVRGATADFFRMFNVPMQRGAVWSRSDDASSAHLAVISEALDQRLFAGKGLGRVIDLGANPFRVVGVFKDWRPAPKFFDLSGGAFSPMEGIVVPVSAAIGIAASPAQMNCWGDPGPADQLVRAPCGWLQAWVELDTHGGVNVFRQNIVNQLMDAGLKDAATRVRVIALRDWLSIKRVVPADVAVQTILAFAFLLLCAVNVAGVMMLKYREKGLELAVRLSLGASRKVVSWHVVSECALLGAAGTALGLAAGSYGVRLIQRGPFDYARIVHIDIILVVVVAVIGLGVVILASSMAVWRIYRIEPGQLIGAN